MANPVSVIDFTNETLAAFLTKLVSDGDYDNVVGDEKVDQVGEEVAATQIAESIGQLWGNVQDDFLLEAYPLLRQVALGSSGSRLVFTPAPAFGGPAGALTYTFSGDEAIVFVDSGPPASPNTLTLTMPPVADMLPGQRIGLLLPDGNSITDLVFVVDGADLIINPATGAAAGAPGTGFTIPSENYAGDTYIEFEMIAAGGLGPAWLFVGDRMDPTLSVAEGGGSSAAGSTNTRIRRWDTPDTPPRGLTWTDSATDGTYLTVARNCIIGVSINYVDTGTAAGAVAINVSAALNNTYNGAHAKSKNDIAVGEEKGPAWIGKANAGDRVWVSTSVASAGGTSDTLSYQFTVSVLGLL